MRTRIWTEGMLALATAVLALVTAIDAEWIELVLRVDPDAGSGTLEWGLLAGLAAFSVVASLAARRDYLRWRGVVAA
jgi:hypothetical protein